MDFLEIKKLFSKDQWDIGYMTETQLKICAHKPIKWKCHVFGLDFTNNVHFEGLRNCIVLVKQTPDSLDYDFYEEVVDILFKSHLKKWNMIYTNFKEAVIQAGLGVRAKNSLIYTYRFGFDSKICVVGFDNKIINTPTNKRVNKKLWNRCVGCWDCAINCPVGAIHNDGNDMEHNWIDGAACDNFIALSDHPRIPSFKKFWHEKVHPEVPKKEVTELKTMSQVWKKYGKYGLPFDKNGYTSNPSFGIKKDGKAVTVSACRECTSQPRCSKWNGKYSY
jgi:ferredoxin